MLTGKRFGRLFVIKKAGKNKSKSILWECLCDCGNTKIVIGSNLRSGDTKSCGCLFKESLTTHGMIGTPVYKTWEMMIQRCYNANYDSYKFYGGRGIIVCDKWLKFGRFFEDMGERPDGLSIDRVDNEKGYFKDNCIWATQTQQIRNRRIQKRNSTGIVGVWWSKQRQRYVAEIMVAYKKYHIGVYKILEQAAIARKKAEQKYWGMEA